MQIERILLGEKLYFMHVGLKMSDVEFVFVMWIWPKLYSLAYYCHKVQILVHVSFDLCLSGVCQC